MKDGDLLTISQTAEYLGLTKEAISKSLRTGRLDKKQAPKFTEVTNKGASKKKIYFQKSELDNWKKLKSKLGHRTPKWFGRYGDKT